MRTCLTIVVCLIVLAALAVVGMILITAVAGIF